MESRKYQLQKQIIEALKANDNDLYSLLKSQWAHRFGVESLEELKNLDLTLLNQKTTNQDNQKIDQSEVYCLKDDKKNSIKDDDNKEKEIRNDTKEVGQSVEAEKKQLLEALSPNKWFERGFCLMKNNKGELVKNIHELNINDIIFIESKDGQIKSLVEEIYSRRK